jgi:hypothetical protein
MEPPKGNEPLKPQRSTSAQVQPIMTPDEKNRFAYQIMQDSDGQIPLEQAMNMADKQNDNILQQNQQIQHENDRRDEYIKSMTADLLTRAENSGLLKDDEDKAVLEKFGMEGSEADTPEERWKYVKKRMEEYETHKQAIRSKGSIAGPFHTIGRKLIGTYKDKQTIYDSVQSDLDWYRENDLIPEARKELGDSLGAGPEDIETMLFPFTNDEKKNLQNFPKNNVNLPKAAGIKLEEDRFPGERYNTSPEKFNELKDNLADYLEKNPGANTIALRGYLNQNLLYSWQDISKAFEQLQGEGRFKPDLIQKQQMPYVKDHPTPGFTSIFKEWWTGAK